MRTALVGVVNYDADRPISHYVESRMDCLESLVSEMI